METDGDMIFIRRLRDCQRSHSFYHVDPGWKAMQVVLKVAGQRGLIPQGYLASVRVGAG